MSQEVGIEIRLFAQAAQLAGTPRVILQLKSEVEGCHQSTIRNIAKQLGSEYPQLEELIGRSRWAVENEFASDDRCIRAGQCIALIPPVSGG